MKRTLIFAIAAYFLMMAIPLPVFFTSKSDNPPPSGDSGTQSGETGRGTETGTETSGTKSPAKAAPEPFKLYSIESEKTYKIDAAAFITGVTALEMYPTYHTEALKAQAAAAYSYYCVMRERQRQSPDPTLDGADFTDTLDGKPIFYTDEQLRERWGENYKAYHEKISGAVADVLDKKLLHNGQPILAIYHAISAGVTESASLVWGGDYPYLVPVTSPGDKLSPNYQTDVTFTAAELGEKLAGSAEAFKAEGEPSKWLGEKIAATSSGMVTEMNICGASLTGKQVREALGLRSCCFTAEYKEEKFYFTVYGYGHNVGMSQYGADYMARQGTGWQDILKHYYTGITIE